MSDIWNGIVDGTFKGGKWGMIAGAVGGTIAGLGAPPAVITGFFMLSFGAAVSYAAVGAVIGLAAGMAVGAALGAVYGAIKDSPSKHKVPRHNRTERHAPHQEPVRSQQRTPDQPPSQPAPASPQPELPPPEYVESYYQQPEFAQQQRQASAPPLNTGQTSTSFQDRVRQSRQPNGPDSFRGL